MKTKTEKILLTVCLLLVIITIITAIKLWSVSFIPNKDKFELNYEEYGPFYGKDEAAIVGEGMYRVSYHQSKYSLYLRHSVGYLLYNGIDFKFENSNLYFYAEDGFAVVYPESNLCKLFIPDAVIRTETINSNPENKLIVYLDSFDEFTKHEQEMLNGVIESHNNYEKFWSVFGFSF